MEKLRHFVEESWDTAMIDNPPMVTAKISGLQPGPITRWAFLQAHVLLDFLADIIRVGFFVRRMRLDNTPSKAVVYSPEKRSVSGFHRDRLPPVPYKMTLTA